MELDKQTIDDIFGWIAAVLTIYFYTVPLSSCYQVIKGKINYEDMPGVYVSLNHINCICWYVYGNLIYSDQIKFLCVVGGIFNLIFLYVYLFYEVKQYPVDGTLNGLIIAVGTYALYKSMSVFIDDDDLMVKICLALCLLLFYFPAQTLYTVTTNKQYTILPYYESWYSILTSTLWIIYSGMYNELYIIFPNSIIILLSIANIVIYCVYKRKYPLIEGREPTSTVDVDSIENEEKKKKENKDEEKEEEIKNKPKGKPPKIVEII